MKLTKAQVGKLVNGLEDVIETLKASDIEFFDMSTLSRDAFYFYMKLTKKVTGERGYTLYRNYRDEFESTFGFVPESFDEDLYVAGLTSLQKKLVNLFTTNICENETHRISKVDFVDKAEKVLLQLKDKLNERTAQNIM